MKRLFGVEPRSVGEGALALVGPLMMHSAGVALSGLVRLAVSRHVPGAPGSSSA